MPKPDNHLFCVSFAIIAIEKWFCTGAKDPGGCGRAQREVENKSVIRQATESDVGGQQRAAIQPATVQFLSWTWGKNPNETEENKTVRCPQIRKKLRGSTEEKKINVLKHVAMLVHFGFKKWNTDTSRYLLCDSRNCFSDLNINSVSHCGIRSTAESNLDSLHWCSTYKTAASGD